MGNNLQSSPFVNKKIVLNNFIFIKNNNNKNFINFTILKICEKIKIYETSNCCMIECPNSAHFSQHPDLPHKLKNSPQIRLVFILFYTVSSFYNFQPFLNDSRLTRQNKTQQITYYIPPFWKQTTSVLSLSQIR